uniref:SPFH domain-containing protein n=1 Tax=Vaginimicrobium propionicum TaxID=1871034 RepID=UPI0012EC3DC4|nr:SPFH domain-containing protein [Vaginimicrobium propionicum]
MTQSTTQMSEKSDAAPVGHDGTQVEIKEKAAWSVGALGAAFLLLGGIVVLGLSIWGFVVSVNAMDAGRGSGSTLACAIATFAMFIVVPIVLTGFVVISPGHTRVVQFFGRYVGTLRRPGMSFTIPFSSRKNVSVRVRNFETKLAKVNDYNGNPIEASAIVVWQVANTAQATFSVEDYEAFITSQSESALRHIATQHPYDSPVDGRVSLRGSTDEVSGELAREVAARVAIAGLEIIETRISSLSYAPEIAQAMLQRQQATAIVDARETIVEGAVSMVQQALDELEQKEIVDLDPERRAAMVSNLLVVLCSDNNAQPVINTGGLYQ